MGVGAQVEHIDGPELDGADRGEAQHLKRGHPARAEERGEDGEGDRQPQDRDRGGVQVPEPLDQSE